jgi:hypothetical protein
MTHIKNFISRKTGFDKLVTFVITLLLCSCASSIFAQSGGVNFSGSWALNEAKSKFGDSQFRMAATLLVVKHEGNNLSDERTQPGFDGGEMKTSEILTLDGKVCENTGMMDSKRKSVVTWSADKKSITISTTMVFDMGGESREMKSSEIWKLGEDGKSLIIETSFTTPDGDMKTTLFYDKK